MKHNKQIPQVKNIGLHNNFHNISIRIRSGLSLLSAER